MKQKLSIDFGEADIYCRSKESEEKKRKIMWDWQKNKYKLLRRRRNCTLAAICKVGVPLVTVKAVTIIPPTLDGVVAISVLAACIVFSSDSFMARDFPN